MLQSDYYINTMAGKTESSLLMANVSFALTPQYLHPDIGSKMFELSYGLKYGHLRLNGTNVGVVQ